MILTGLIIISGLLYACALVGITASIQGRRIRRSIRQQLKQFAIDNDRVTLRDVVKIINGDK